MIILVVVIQNLFVFPNYNDWKLTPSKLDFSTWSVGNNWFGHLLMIHTFFII